MNDRKLSITHGLILSNIAVFLLAGVLPTVNNLFGIPYPAVNNPDSILFVRGAYSWYSCFMEGQVWRLISYQFLHAGTFHLIFNMWALYFFGPAAEQVMGPRRFLAFYLVCGVAGALFSSLVASSGLLGNDIVAAGAVSVLSQYTGTPLELWQVVPMVGASAAIYGVLVSVAFMYPHLQVSLIFPPVTMSLRTFALVVLGLAVATVMTHGNNAGGEAGHLGGIIMSAIIMMIWRQRIISRRSKHDDPL